MSEFIMKRAPGMLFFSEIVSDRAHFPYYNKLQIIDSGYFLIYTT